ncbi:Erg28 like protein-domain-containing protein [Podospora fimiseda]|uniref:Erg28 like protein-domain-containing protein n=1 Tax=Podospora fimiseda TaxID=252190 RepID=A0AAN7BM43_9PEZI|nr:Erg28 like protein-domain-containing protein [Podospora fimiseda]
MSSFLPPNAGGLLPYFLLLQSTLAIGHSIICYTGNPDAAMKQFSGPLKPTPQHTGLSARLYGLKNIYTGLIRGYAAYNITNPQVYALAQASFVGVLFLYMTELFVYKTARVKECMFPFVGAGGLTLWMWLQKDFYLPA